MKYNYFWNKKVARRVSYKKQELLTISKYLSSHWQHRCTGQTRNQIDNPEKLTTQVHRTNTESNVLCTCVVSFSGLSIWFRVCLCSPVLSVSLDCLFDSVFVFVHLCYQFLWIVYLIPCLSCAPVLSVGERRQTRNQIDNPEKLTTQVDEDKHGIK
jgi:hypothetical protein